MEVSVEVLFSLLFEIELSLDIRALVHLHKWKGQEKI